MQLAAQPAAPADQPDPYVQLAQELEDAKKRLLKNPPADVGSIACILAGDVLDFMKDTVALSARLRNETFEAYEELDNRLGDIESARGSQLEPEDATKFEALCRSVDYLINLIPVGQSAEVTAELTKLRALAAECLEIVGQVVLPEDEEDEEDEEIDEEAPQS
jgi:hypothetical protein